MKKRIARIIVAVAILTAAASGINTVGLLPFIGIVIVIGLFVWAMENA